MSYLVNIFGCCNRDKSYNKSDIEIKKVKSLNENNNTLISSEKISITNQNPSNSFLNNSRMNNKNINININHNEEEDKKSAAFPKISQKSLVNNNDDKMTNKNLALKIPIANNSSLSITDFLVQEKKEENFSKLMLTGDLFFGKELIITDTGLINSKRSKKDGFTFFGLKNTKDISGQFLNDFVINFNKPMEQFNSVENGNETGKVFEIIFNKKNKEYSLFFLNPFLYLYYKINNFVYFYPQKDYFLFVGKIFLSINIQKEENLYVINIQVDNTSENNEIKEELNKKYTFDQNKGVIKIGRANCDINIAEKCISKVHGIIEFSIISQQFYYKDMNSTNGTNLLIKKDDSLKIKGEMNFKLEDVTFKIQEMP